MFQQYPQSDVNEPIPLHEGRFRVWAGDRCVEGSGSAQLRWLPSPGIEFDIEITEPFPGVGFDSLTVELPGFRTEKVVAHSMTLGSTRLWCMAPDLRLGASFSACPRSGATTREVSETQPVQVRQVSTPGSQLARIRGRPTSPW